MPVTATNKLVEYDESDLTTYTTTSWTPTANKLALVSVSSSVPGGDPAPSAAPTLSGNSLTYVLVRSQTVGTRYRLSTYRAMGASPTAGSISIAFAEQQARAWWIVDEFDGIDTGGTNGSAAVVQSADNTATSGTSLTVTLAAFGSANNATYGTIANETNDNIVPGTGFTELAENSGSGFYRPESEFRNDNDTTVDWSWASSTARVVGIAIEIAAEAVAAERNFQTLLGVR